MDLAVRGRRDLAECAFETWVAATGDAGARQLLASYVAYRSAVRGKVAGLSLVFRAGDRARQRIKQTDAESMARSATADGLSPNVLLRPVMERAILPTVAYVAGPGELAYFAQVGAVAEALGAAPPLAVPRWSCTILEPHVAEVLARLRLDPEVLRDPHAAETRVAKGRLPEGVSSALTRLGTSLTESLSALASADAELVSPAAIDGARRNIAARIARLERRYTAAMKRRVADVVQQIGTARGSLYPGGKRQERVLNLLPLLARYGEPLLADMQGAARQHAALLIGAARDARAAGHAAHSAPSP